MKRPSHWGAWFTMVATAAMCGVRPTPLDGLELPAVTAIAEAPLRNDSSVAIDWRVLRTLNFQTGAMSDTLRALHGRRVRIPGFIVPLEDFTERAKEFLLVPYFGACIHLPPPPPNQMVLATMSRGEATTSTWNPVWIEGIFRVAAVRSPYGKASFRMQVERILPYEEK
jgi:uncharacterized protein